MLDKIKIAICGYGNLGKGVESEINKFTDMELVGIFTRRDPETIETASFTPVWNIVEIEDIADKIDVMIMCGGSATDLPIQVQKVAKFCNIVDSFDTHAKIPVHFDAIDEIASKAGKTALISCGWDPGLFSLMRVLGDSILPNGDTYTFWGKGVSQGHSDAIRRIDGVKDAKQYTIPIEEAVNRVRNGENPELTTAQKHLRECFVVAEEGADTTKIEHEIKTMPNYFADYETTVHFITENELKENYSKMPHGGMVLRTAKTGKVNKHVMEFSLNLDSNPEFTSSVLLAYARAVYRMNKANQYGAKTVFDISPGQISQKTPEELRKEFL